jgi:polysaccharide deacetylase family protein (PEP-CTERM system associated)
MLLNAFSVDVEDYFQVSGFEKEIRREDWSSFESRVVESTQRLLKLLDRHDVKATFFVLGWVADHYPDLVAQIAEAGHELASHSYWHRLVYELSPEEFREDLCRSREAIRRAVDQPIVGYRAPSFSITRKSLWALDVLAEEGFKFDSSVFPTRHPRYGIPGARKEIHQIETTNGRLWEFPPAVRKYGGVNMAVAGGGYFRLYPLRFTCHALKSINRTGQPFVFYVHPWEVDPHQPRLRAGSWASRFRHYVNLASTERKLDHLLSRFRFGTVSEVILRHAHEKAA